MKQKFKGHKFFGELFMEIIFSFTSHYPNTPVPVVNYPIRSKIPSPNIG